jgi:hypothetical protein
MGGLIFSLEDDFTHHDEWLLESDVSGPQIPIKRLLLPASI